MASWSTSNSAGGGGGGGGGAVDQTYGQRSVFGAMGQATAPVGDADLDCEDEQEALAYLQLVRAEAMNIPHVLVAPKPTIGPQAFPPHLSAGRRAPRTPEAAESSQPTRRQLLPESSATINKKRRRRRRLRHWDEEQLDDGGGERGSKRRMVSRQQAVAVELSYDDEGESAGGGRAPPDRANGAGLSYDDEEDEGEASDDGCGYGKNGGDKWDDDQDEENREEEEEEEEEEDGYYQPDRSIYENGVGDARGYYQDGAYVAAPDMLAAVGVEEVGGAGLNQDASDGAAAAAAAAAEAARFTAAYRAHLLAQFVSLRELLQQDNDPEAVAALPADNQETDVGPLSTRTGTFRRWLRLLQTTDPWPAQVRAMDKLSVLRLLRVLQRGLLAGGPQAASRSSRSGRFARSLLGAGDPRTAQSPAAGLDLTPRTSRWLWALLARLPGAGELDHREVGSVREVAKQAALRLAHLSYGGGAAAASVEEEAGSREVEDEQEHGGDYEDEEEEADQEEDYRPGGRDGDRTAEGETVGLAQQPEEKKLRAVEAEEGELLGGKGDGAAEEHIAADKEDVAMDLESDAEDENAEGGPSRSVVADTEVAPGRLGAAEAGGNTGRDQQDGEQGDAPQDEHDADMHQRATLEMVLAVVGEFYGQRDLLAFRSPWPSVGGAP